MRRSSDTIRLVPALNDALRYPFRNRHPLVSTIQIGIILGLVLLPFLILAGVVYGLIGFLNIDNNFPSISTVGNLIGSMALLVVAPFLGYSVRITQASMRGIEYPPQVQLRKQLRLIVEVLVIWTIILYFSELIVLYTSSLLFADLTPIGQLAGNLTWLTESNLYTKATSIIGNIENWYGVSLIDVLLLGYTLPAVLSIYSQHERLSDFLSLERLKNVLLNHGYMKLGTYVTILWFIFRTLAEIYRRAVWEPYLNAASEFPLILPIVLFPIDIMLIILLLGIMYMIPMYVFSRLIGLYWRTIEPSQAEKNS